MTPTSDSTTMVGGGCSPVCLQLGTGERTALCWPGGSTAAGVAAPPPPARPPSGAGQGHPMKPHRVRMANSLVLHYGLYSKLDGVRGCGALGRRGACGGGAPAAARGALAGLRRAALPPAACAPARAPCSPEHPPTRSPFPTPHSLLLSTTSPRVPQPKTWLPSTPRTTSDFPQHRHTRQHGEAGCGPAGSASSLPHRRHACSRGRVGGGAGGAVGWAWQGVAWQGVAWQGVAWRAWRGLGSSAGVAPGLSSGPPRRAQCVAQPSATTSPHRAPSPLACPRSPAGNPTCSPASATSCAPSTCMKTAPCLTACTSTARYCIGLQRYCP